MFKNYFKIALRNIQKHKLYSLINIFGLTLGITCCIIIYLFISDEFSYDSFHENKDNIYRVEVIEYKIPKWDVEPNPFFDTREAEGVNNSPWLPLPLGPTLKDRYPEIVHFTRPGQGSVVVRNENQSFDQEVLYTDPSFFEMFSFPLLQGSPEIALKDPNNIVLTPETVQKYFGNEDPMGKSLTLKIRNADYIFTVAGVAETPPSNSSIPFSFVMNITKTPYHEFNVDRWNSFNTPVFVQLQEGTDIAQFESKLNDFAKEQFGEKWPAARERLGLPENAPVLEFGVTALSDIHLTASIEWPGVSNPLYSYILGIISVLILLIACINYITLALARSTSRAKEVGIRKTSGAKRNQIALQFWGETQLLTVLAMIAGVGLVELTLPFFNDIAGKSLAINYMEDFGFLMALLSVTLIAGLIAGAYPAILLAGYQPVKALKGSLTLQFKPRLTKGLLVVQYSLSIFLIISAVIMYKQLDYVSSKELGYNADQVLFVPTYTGWNESGTNLMELYRNELNDVAGVKMVSGLTPAFTSGTNRYAFGVDGEEVHSYIYFVDPQIVPTLGFELIAGRNFSEDRPSDKAEAIVVNEAFVNTFGWDDPIGKLVPWKGEDNPSTVIGVIKDFHFQSLETEIEPMLFHMDHQQGGINSIAVKIEEGMIAETLPQLEEVWAEIAPFTPFNFWFLDDAVAQQYEQYQQWLKIMGSSTFIAILIACLGLFGLAGLTAVNKTKEIGIRKVLGAGINQIILLLNKDIVTLIFISLIIAGPISWYVMNQWLTDFTYRITIGFDVFIISALFAFLIAIATISYHSIRAANANPVDSLKSE